MKGKAYKFSDNISTDLIISGRYKFAIQDSSELAKHVMEDADPEFVSKITKNEAFIVAGENWGMGSSREQAPLAIKYAGINAVLAKSFARIFYRNAINIGLLLIQCDTDKINPGDKLKLNLEEGIIENLTQNIKIKVNPIPPLMLKLLHDGGLVEHFKKNKGFSV